MSFTVGQFLSVVDAVDQQVRRCKIVEVNENEANLKIHYVNWSSSSDEWVDFDSDRICRDTAEDNSVSLGKRKEAMAGCSDFECR